MIVGKRALPAIAVTNEADVLELLAEPDDMVMAFDDSCGWTSSDSKPVYLSIGYGGSGAEWDFDPGCADPFVAQELVETRYHLPRELAQVTLEHPGPQGGAAPGRRAGAGVRGRSSGVIGQEALARDSDRFYPQVMQTRIAGVVEYRHAFASDEHTWFEVRA